MTQVDSNNSGTNPLRNLIRIIVLVLFTFLVGAYIFDVIITKFGEPDFRSILLSLTTTILPFATILLFGRQITEYLRNSERMELLNGIREIHKEFDDTLIYADADSSYRKAANYIKNCNIIRIVGHIDDSQYVLKGVQEYLNEAENRVKENPHLKYRRLTSSNLQTVGNQDFRNHLKNCLQYNNNHEIEIVFLSNFSPSTPYVIVDDKFLMLSPSYQREETKGQNCLYTEKTGSKIIKEFIALFDARWTIELGGKNDNFAIKSAEEFEFVNDFQSKWDDCINNIRSRANRLSKKGTSTLLQNYMLAEMVKFIGNEYLMEDQARGRSHELPHPLPIENQIMLYISLMDQLNESDEYWSIAFVNHWSNILKSNVGEKCIIANQDVIKRGIRIKRFLIVCKNRINKDNSYLNDASRIVREHIDMIKTIGNQATFYDFRILLVDDENDYLNRNNHNFILIQSTKRGEFVEISINKTNDDLSSTLQFGKLSDIDRSDNFSKLKFNRINEKWLRSKFDMNSENDVLRNFIEQFNSPYDLFTLKILNK